MTTTPPVSVCTDPVDTLTRVIHTVIGEHAQPRDVQRDLVTDIYARMTAVSGHTDRSQSELFSTAHIAPVGSGKSFAYLVPAMLASLRKERTIISTETLSLQAQLFDKDAPAVGAVFQELYGVTPTVAVVKGARNYACFHAVEASIDQLCKEQAMFHDGTDESRKLALFRIQAMTNNDEVRTRASLLSWAITCRGNGGTADRAQCPVSVTDAQWARVLHPACPAETGADRHTMCGHGRAKHDGARADIVITNHALMAVQATRPVRAVHGGALGEFHHIVIDEAHQLSPVIRAQGHRKLTPALLRAYATMFTGAENTSLSECADTLARLIEETGEGVIETEDDVFDSTIMAINTLMTTCDPQACKDAEKARTLRRDIEDAVSGFPTDAQWKKRSVQWVEDGALHTSPVNVAPLCVSHLFTRPDGSPLSVTCVSGTLPRSFSSDIGLGGRVHTHDSPFASAYADASVVIDSPRDVEKITNDWGKFDTGRHAQWAVDRVVKHVTDNGGHALVLAATSKAGKAYAQALRERTDFDVYSQWDGVGVGEVVARFRANTSSVCVGTKSLMTGTDVPGESLTLVIIDRVARARPNIVDDARVSARVDAGDSPMMATHRVYVSDASLVFTQAVGRLIRRADDRGKVVVLDPRLSKQSPLAYPALTRKEYRKAFAGFGSITVLKSA